MLSQLGDLLGHLASSEDPRVDLRMEGLDLATGQCLVIGQ